MKTFSPFQFLMALGAGGIAVSGFTFLNYTVPHGKGLITYAQVHAMDLSLSKYLLYSATEISMIFFAIVHLALTGYLVKKLIDWKKTEEHTNSLENPLTNSSLMIPFVSFFMTMNVFLAVIRYFVPVLSDNLQQLMLPGFAVWMILWIFLMRLEIKLLAMAFSKKFDSTKINFGWLMQPFALSMATVTGTGIAALSTNASLAHVAAFVSLISFTMGSFLLAIGTIFIFKNYFAAEKMPESSAMPSTLIIVPILTILGISLFRYGHYFERHFDAHLGPFFAIVTVLTFAFQTWYLFFGLSFLRNYFKSDFRKEHHVSQWGLICPFVAYAVMGNFVFATFVQSTLLLSVIIILTVIFIALYLFLLSRQIKETKIQGLAIVGTKIQPV